MGVRETEDLIQSLEEFHIPSATLLSIIFFRQVDAIL